MRSPPREQEDSQKAELHRPPPLPQGSHGCDHHARAALAQTGTFITFLLVFILASFLRVLTKNSESLIVVFIVMPEHDFVKKFLICVF